MFVTGLISENNTIKWAIKVQLQQLGFLGVYLHLISRVVQLQNGGGIGPQNSDGFSFLKPAFIIVLVYALINTHYMSTSFPQSAIEVDVKFASAQGSASISFSHLHCRISNITS